MTGFKWQSDNWTSIDTEEGEVWDMNLYKDDITDECRLVFYPTFINDKGKREIDTSGSNSKIYKVTEESE
jgi:hypothetical protein